MSSGRDDDGQSVVSTNNTPTPISHLHRNMSHSSPSWSAADTPHHHNHGSSYFTQPSSSPTRTRPNTLHRSSSAHSARRAGRSTSISSATREDALADLDEEDDPDPDNDDARSRVLRRKHSKSIAIDPDSDDSNVQNLNSSALRDEDDPMTLKERQSLINVEHPFGLPIWKPALYKKSRSITTHADQALHNVPSAQAERHLLPGNIFWVLVFGWWLSIVCFLISAILYIIPQGGKRWATLVYGLGWYIAWPFGKYVEGDEDILAAAEVDEDVDESDLHYRDDTTASSETVRLGSDADGTIRAGQAAAPLSGSTQHNQSLSWNPPTESTSLLHPNSVLTTTSQRPAKSYGTTTSPSSSSSSIGVAKRGPTGDTLGRICFWLCFITLIAPLMLIVCLICWALVVTIPMAKLNWQLMKHLWEHPASIRFCSAPSIVVVNNDVEAQSAEGDANGDGNQPVPPSRFSIKHPRISPGQAAPSGTPSSTVLLCTYRAVGLEYYKYTVGGVNIMFVNLMPVVFFVILDGLFLLPIVEERHENGKHVPAFLALIASQSLIFFMSLMSVIPLSYFIGMAVASISAQSSIGMGAVINATFGSIIEIILYALALTQSKGHLVEGSIIGSLIAGILLMPGLSMVSSALRKKEQKFNAKSAGVTSMMLIMAIIGTLTPTFFYQVYGNFQLVCQGCTSGTSDPWRCDKCYYQHPDPADDDFYQSTVKKLGYFCAIVLVLSYLIGLWFSLRTHASQIWQNPQELLKPMDLPPMTGRQSIYQRFLPSAAPSNVGARSSLLHKASFISNPGHSTPPRTPISAQPPHISITSPVSPSTSGRVSLPRRVSYAQQPSVPPNTGIPANMAPVMESVDHAVKNSNFTDAQLPGTMTTDEFTRAVAVATVSALRHQQAHGPPGRLRVSAGEDHAGGGGHGGHDAPNWSRTTSASVLLACTFLYALIAEILVEVVDVILEGSGIAEKFLGVTVFALVPNTTEFMNAISFALNGNIALSMEIGSAYALQVCLLQIPAMVAFSAWWAPEKMGEVANTFTLIFPRWDSIVIILSMFLMTYVYIEARSNYHRGSILILSYLVLMAGFYFAPPVSDTAEFVGSLMAGGTTRFVLTPLQNIHYWLRSSW